MGKNELTGPHWYVRLNLAMQRTCAVKLEQDSWEAHALLLLGEQLSSTAGLPRHATVVEPQTWVSELGG